MELTQPATILSVTDLTPNVRQLTILPDSQQISFLPGQWISLKVPHGSQPPLNRAYSLATPASPSGELTLVFDRVPQGIGSSYLQQLNTGDTVTLSGPYGNFVLPQPVDREILFITRYTGLVPIWCMLKALYATHADHPTLLLAVGPSQDELLYHHELLSLASRHPLFRYIPLVASTEELAVELTIEKLRALIETRPQSIPMLCGTKAFVQPLRHYFVDAGYDRKEVRAEMYG